MRELRSSGFSVFVLLVNFLAISGSANLCVLASGLRNGEEGQPLWETYTSKGEEFSVLMPELPGVIVTTTYLDSLREKQREDRTYAAYSGGVVYLVTSYSNPNHRQSLKQIIAERLEWFSSDNFVITPQGKATLNKFPGEVYAIKSNKTSHNGISKFFLTKDHVYEIAVRTEDLSQPSIQKFFESFKVGRAEGKEIGVGARTGAVSPAVTPATKATPVAPKLDVERGGGGPGGVSGDGEKTLKPNEVTHKAVIILKPSPEYTEQARQNQISGTVTLQMVLTSSGKVTSIRTVSGLTHGLTEKAIVAARKIYFLPAVKDGKRVSQYIRVEYNFSIY